MVFRSICTTFATETIKTQTIMGDDMRERYINPYIDFGFKKLFGTEMNKDLLISFLNALLDKPGYEEDSKAIKARLASEN